MEREDGDFLLFVKKQNKITKQLGEIKEEKMVNSSGSSLLFWF